MQRSQNSNTSSIRYQQITNGDIFTCRCYL